MRIIMTSSFYIFKMIIVSDVSGFLIRRQNRPDILSAGEEVVNANNNDVIFLHF